MRCSTHPSRILPLVGSVALALLVSLSIAMSTAHAEPAPTAPAVSPAPHAAPAPAASPSNAPASGAAAATAAAAGMAETWNQPFAPFHILGNIHYVGARGVSSFLITTPAGAILLDGGLPETAPWIEKSIAKLGFELRDVKVLLNSHAHFDHAGGLAALKKASHAKLVASRGDAPALRAGSPQQPAVSVDRVVDDGDTVELGGTVLTAHVTPGHTPGCTTWTMTTTEAERSLRVVFYCSTSVIDRLVGNAHYPSIVADYNRSFKALRDLPCDVFLAPHGDFFQLAPKRERMSKEGPNPFIDPSELRSFVEKSEQQFRESLKRESAAQ
jgi:metallo-beta-lactamase class B